MAIKQDSFRIEEGKNYLSYAMQKYGEDVQIVKVSQVVGRTPTTPAILEVVVAVDKEPINTKQSEVAGKYIQNDDVSIEFSQQALKKYNDLSSPIDIEALKEPKQIKYTSKPSINKFEKIRDEKQILNELSSKIDLLMSMRWGELAPSRNNLEIPPEFALIYDKAKKSDMLQEHLDEIMLVTLKNMPKALLSSKDAINRYFQTLLRNMIPCRVDAPIRKQKIIMLVGPTGVGKTTTLAKLAYRYAYGSTQRYETAIISLDDFRLGAKEQLAEYVKLMGLKMRFISTQDDLQKSLKSLSDCSVILIDSTGNSQYDHKKINKLKGYLSASESEIEVTLVLNAGMKYDDMMDTYEAFNVLRIDTLIFTKFDESKTFGNIFSLIYNTKKPVSFFSIGQNVPEDILVANSDYLTKCILNGFKG